MTTRDRDPVYDKHFEVKRRGLKIFKIFEHVTSCNILKRNTRKSILQRLWCVWHHDDPSMLQGWVTWNRGSKLRLVEPSQTWITVGDRVDIWSLKGFHWFQNNHNTQQLTIFDPYIFGAHFFLWEATRTFSWTSMACMKRTSRLFCCWFNSKFGTPNLVVYLFFPRCHMGHGLGYPGYTKNFETNQDGSQWTWTVFHGTRSDWLGFSNDFLSNGLRAWLDSNHSAMHLESMLNLIWLSISGSSQCWHKDTDLGQGPHMSTFLMDKKVVATNQAK